MMHRSRQRIGTELQKQVRLGFSSSVSRPSDRGLYELRAYDVQPHMFPSFLALTNQKIHLRTAHSQLVGYWSVEYGALNQVFHIWRYESYSQRAAVRSSLAQDADWLEQYVSKAIPMLTKQNNEVCRLLWGLQPPTAEGGVFELQRFHVKRLGWSGQQSHHAPGLGQLVGAFSNDVGDNNIVQLLWWFQSPDSWAETKDQRETAGRRVEHLDPVSNKLMFPLPFSPMK